MFSSDAPSIAPRPLTFNEIESLATIPPENALGAEIALEVVDSWSYGCLVIGFDLKCVFANRRISEQLRKPLHELIGRRITECCSGVDATAVLTALRRCMTSCNPDHARADLPVQGGETAQFELRFVPVAKGVCILSSELDTEAAHGTALGPARRDPSEREEVLATLVFEGTDALSNRGRPSLRAVRDAERFWLSR